MHARIGELKAQLAEESFRLNEHATAIAALQQQEKDHEHRIGDCEADCGSHGEEIARLDERTSRTDVRTKHVIPSLGVTLSSKQKAALITALVTVGGALLDSARHVIAFVIAYLSQHPPKP